MLRVCGWLLLCLSINLVAKEQQTEYQVNFKNIGNTIWQDYQAFYTKKRLTRVAGMFAVGAVMAHTNIDTEFQDWHQSNIHSERSDDVSKVAKNFGEKFIMMPLAIAASAIEFKNPNSFWAEWGQLSTRAYLLGGPIIGVTQPLTGGSRPKDEYKDAHWRPFNDDNGVSGHSFVGAVPFLALTKMEQLEDWQKTLAYVASGLGAWSRINDDAHYLSQAMLGWYVAWESLNAISETEQGDWYQIKPVVYGDGIGLGIAFEW